mgnify:CR=1 FL=1
MAKGTITGSTSNKNIESKIKNGTYESEAASGQKKDTLVIVSSSLSVVYCISIYKRISIEELR